MTKTLLDFALEYHDKGLAVVPIGNKSKAPTTKNWQSKKMSRVELEDKFSNGHNVTGIGIITGEMSNNLVNLDFDKAGWQAAFDNCLHCWPQLETAPIIGTGSNKRHIWFTCPDLPSDFTHQEFKRDDAIIDLRANRCNNLAPPSLHPSGNRYRWLSDSADLPEVKFDDIRAWLTDWGETTTTEPEEMDPPTKRHPLPAKTVEFLTLPGPQPEGGRNTALLAASQQFYAAGYTLAEAIEKLEPVAMRIGLGDKEIQKTIKSGFGGAKKAGFRPVDRKKKPRLKRQDYIKILSTLGYTFTMNAMNDRLVVNDESMTDPMRATIRSDLRDAGYKRHLTATEDAYLAHGYANQYHPIRDWLDSLQWNNEPQIATLASYFTDTDDIFYTWLKRWLIGCVAKIYQPGQTQNMMLAMDGPQNIGKSYFAHWLCSAVPDLFIESPLNPDNKDHTLRLISKFVWEVGELGATMRKADREALKFTLTRQTVTERAPYGRFDMTKPVTCNFIGTINDEAGFLTDPTGNRRFFTCELTSINWDYTQLDINQVWAEVVSLYHQGEPWQLTPGELAKQSTVNARYRLDSYALGLLLKYYDIDPDGQDWTSSADILQRLGTLGLRGSDRTNSMELSSGLRELGIKRQKQTSEGGRMWGYWGVTPKIV